MKYGVAIAMVIAGGCALWAVISGDPILTFKGMVAAIGFLGVYSGCALALEKNK